jgi:hypothetical protein
MVLNKSYAKMITELGILYSRFYFFINIIKIKKYLNLIFKFFLIKIVATIIIADLKDHKIFKMLNLYFTYNKKLRLIF